MKRRTAEHTLILGMVTVGGLAFPVSKHAFFPSINDAVYGIFIRPSAPSTKSQRRASMTIITNRPTEGL